MESYTKDIPIYDVTVRMVHAQYEYVRTYTNMSYFERSDVIILKRDSTIVTIYKSTNMIIERVKVGTVPIRMVKLSL